MKKKLIKKIKSSSKIGAVFIAVFVSSNALAQDIFLSNVTVSEVLIFEQRAFFRTNRTIDNPANCPNDSYYALGSFEKNVFNGDGTAISRAGERFDLIKFAMENGEPVNIIINGAGCVGGVYPAVRGVGKSRNPIIVQ